MKEALLPQLTDQPLVPSKRPPLPFLFDIQGNPIEYTGYYDFKLTDHNGLDVTFSLYVVPSCASDILLGNDFMRLTRAQIDVFNQQVTFDNPKGEFGSISAAVGCTMTGSSEFRASPVNDTIVEANDTTWVTLQIEAGASVQLRPGASVVLLNKPTGPLSIVDSILTVEENNRVTVPISNQGFDSATLTKGLPLNSTTILLSDDLRLSPAAQVAAAVGAHRQSSPLRPLSEK